MNLWVSAFLVVALADWYAVAAGRRAAERVLKPLALVLLIAVAVSFGAIEDGVGVAVLIALGCGLLGDVLLLRTDQTSFMAGLAAFLVGHLAYALAIVTAGLTPSVLVPGLIALALVVVGRRIVAGAHRAGGSALAVAVTAYIVVIGAMTALAAMSPWSEVFAGAVLFLVSDAILGWTRFVTPLRWGRTATMVTYHLGQLVLVVGLLG